MWDPRIPPVVPRRKTHHTIYTVPCHRCLCPTYGAYLCWACTQIRAAHRANFACEHLWQDQGWRITGRTISLKGKDVSLNWTRVCTLCRTVEAVALNPKEHPQDLQVTGLQEPPVWANGGLQEPPD